MKKKYELIPSDSIKIGRRTLYRIRALRNIEARDHYAHGIVYRGDLGGYVESEMNLAQRGESWIFPGAVAYDYARVSGHARIFGTDKARGENAKIDDLTKVCGFAKVRGRSTVYGKTIVTDGVIIGDSATIGQISDAKLPDSLVGIYGDTWVHGAAHIIRSPKPDGLITLRGNISLGGNIKLVDTSLDGTIILKTPLTCNGMIH